MRHSKILAAIAGLVVLVLGCGGGEGVAPEFGDPNGVGTLNISMDDFKFTPDNIKLTVGQQCCQSATMGQIGTRENCCYGEATLSFLTVRL